MRTEVEPIHPGAVVRRPAVYEEGPVIVSVPIPEFPPVFSLLSWGRRKKVDQWIADLIRAREELDDKSLRVLEEDLADKGLFGTHELLGEPIADRGVWGQTKGGWKLNGRLFLLFGSLEGEGKIEGSTRTVSSVRFAWSPREGEILITEIPADKLIINHCPETEVPTVSFEFNAKVLIVDVEKRWRDDRACCRKVMCFPHPNDYLQGDRLARANLTIASGGLEPLSLPASEGNVF